MKFFIPSAKTEKEAQEVLQAIAKNATGKSNFKPIYQLHFKHDGNESIATVGEKLDSGDYKNHEKVIAILKSDDMCFICTPNRGVVRDIPILVGKHDILGIICFENQ